MTATVRRKNLGKQFTCVDDKSRYIFHWYRPGQPLPILLTHEGQKYMLTKDHIAEAQASGRSKLMVFKADDYGLTVIGKPQVNGKGSLVQVVHAAAKVKAIAYAAYGAVLAAAGGLSYSIVKGLEGIAW